MKKVVYRTAICSILGIVVFCKCHEVKAQVVINEIHYNPSIDLTGDANKDGVRSASHDEFVEIVNANSSSVDISGYTLSDADGVSFTVPNGIIMQSNQALVVFGGGVPTGSFGGALVFTKSLGLNNADNYVVLKSASGLTVDSVFYKTNFAIGKSLTRDLDITGAFVPSTAIGLALFSPGFKNDGSTFSDLLDIKENSFELKSSVFPNPIIDLINMEGMDVQNASLISLNGEVVDLDILNQQALVPRSVISGVYYLKTYSNQNTFLSKLLILK